MFFALALILLFALPWPWSLVGFLGSLALFAGEVAFWHRRMRRQPRAVGRQQLIGATGVVVSTCRPDGQARVDGTLWAARCEDGAGVGETVAVVAVDELTLVVRPAAKPTSRRTA